MADANHRRFTGVVGVGIEGETKNGDALDGQVGEQRLHQQLSDAVLLPGIKVHHALPVGRHLM